MSRRTTYCCNLCESLIRPDTENGALPGVREGVGLQYGTDGRGTLKPVERSSIHVCYACAESIHDGWRRLTTTTPPATAE